MRRLPPIGRRQAVGLLGGSFDPPHAGHVQVTQTALRRLGLDRVWWLVSPGNPLKTRGPAPLPQRMAAARAILRGHPRVQVTDIEVRLGTRYTAETLTRLRRLAPGLRLVWIMGSDNLLQFHRWHDWQRIMRMVPVCVVARPGARLAARFAPAARAFRHAQLNESEARALARRKPPAWVVLNMPLNPLSSTALRHALSAE
ncbi:nicotinate-nucleotide adenylyltransferase [Rubellimicrobium thermophilum DSM 16684]|uniref:Probable nicotinate-nucleotide adenylyltransferase n=1 Tax=Rubellimicrobium thermophilum DSM 16684 TaxID=1123069 RepID=S9QY77_9RHOB|nr:nicotinate-nucleotide adenylyltransferase [Rubellimicrobium thermophilum]EPX86346.1 nicotinate-nucleotide adenylyltransferase [Rubellimicrobium thermophilum DSM 16684]